MTAAAEQRDFALSACLYRMSLHARAIEHDLRRNYVMASMLVAAADVAGELATKHSDEAMLLVVCGPRSSR